MTFACKCYLRRTGEQNQLFNFSPPLASHPGLRPHRTILCCSWEADSSPFSGYRVESRPFGLSGGAHQRPESRRWLPDSLSGQAVREKGRADPALRCRTRAGGVLLLQLTGDELGRHRAAGGSSAGCWRCDGRPARGWGRGLGPPATGVLGSARGEPEQGSLPLPVHGEGADQFGQRQARRFLAVEDRLNDVGGQRGQLQDAHHIGVVHVQGPRQIRNGVKLPALNRVRPGERPAQGLNHGRLNVRWAIRNIAIQRLERKSSSGPASAGCASEYADCRSRSA